MFNARIETVDTGNALKDAFWTTRCLIPADGFYEWTKSLADGGKDPWHIHLPDHAPFSFAGLWAHNKKLGITSCTIITAPAVEPASRIQNRMPVILDQSAYEAWLDPSTTAPNRCFRRTSTAASNFTASDARSTRRNTRTPTASSRSIGYDGRRSQRPNRGP
jgi:putative SOS response-associated peptidase YedK